MDKVGNVTVSPNAVTFKRHSINKKDIISVDYKPPRNIISAIWFGVSKYLILICLIIGIPFAIMEIMKSMNHYTVRFTLRQHERGKNKVEMWYLTPDEVDYMKQNF